MPEWVWVLALFVGITAGYFVGYKLGQNEFDEAPTTNAWINVHKYGIDSQTEIEKYRIDKEHEFNVALMERGCYDGLPEDDSDVEEEDK